jgi:hypothetical protein
MHRSRVGLTDGLSGFVTELTQFLDSSDLVSVERVCRGDHATTQALWRLCESLCRFKDPLRPQPMTLLRDPSVARPFCSAYIWSVAHTVATTWVDHLSSKSSGTHIQVAIQIDARGAPVCTHVFCPTGCNWTAYEVSWRGATHEIRPQLCNDTEHVCPRMTCIWGQDLYPLVKGPRHGVRTMLHVLARIGGGDGFPVYVFLDKFNLLDPTIAMWFALGIAPTLKVSRNIRTWMGLLEESELFQTHEGRITFSDDN